MLGGAQGTWQRNLAQELAAAEARWETALDSTLPWAEARAASALDDHAQTFRVQLQEKEKQEGAKQREAGAGATTETEQRLVALRESLQGHSQRLEEAVARAAVSAERLDNFSARIESAKQQALGEFQSQLDDVLSLHRNELHRRSESLAGEI